MSLRECLESGWIGYGPKCKELEQRFEKRGGFALATANCTAAIYLAGRICQVGDKNEVIIPAMSFVSTAMAFHCAGMKVKLVDVDPLTGLLDVNKLEHVIGPRTRAIVIVHLFGQHAPISVAREICDRHGLLLIEDCAHRIDLLDVGTPLADITCYSFNAVKEVPAGECGLLWCRDESLINLARVISNVGLTVDTPMRARSLVHCDYGFSEEVGLKLRANDLVATLVSAGLDILTETRLARRSICEAYNSSLFGSEVVEPLDRHADDSFLMYVVRVCPSRRQEIRESLARMLIATSIHYPSLSRHPLFFSDQASKAEQLDKELLTIPCYPSMSKHDISRVADGLAEVALIPSVVVGSRWPQLTTEGIVASGYGILLAWPEPHEYDLITNLRNHTSTSKWFLNQRRLNLIENRRWLSQGMRRGPEGLLVIRHEASQRFLGTIGWSDHHPDTKVACFGRLMVDISAVINTFGRIPKNEPRIATRAAILLRNYAFEVMGLTMLTTWYLEGNYLAAKVNKEVGMEIEGRFVRRGTNGEPVVTMQMSLSRSRWMQIRHKT
jgi:dTDP-4-amino-4,6-dideoxygalactose transaminase/RimJ/RimL family protein N-acetyltransferase